MNYTGKFQRFNFIDWPQALSKADYQEAAALAAADLKKNPDIRAIYLMGKNWVPGISDLDMVAVYRDGVKNLHGRDPRSLTEKAKYIFTHDYAHFTESVFKNINWIYPPKFQLFLLQGQETAFADPQKELPEKEYKLLQASFALDFLVTKLFLYPLYAMAKSINTRRFLPWLYSFVYTIEQAEEASGERIGSPFPEKIRNLRESWFSKEKSADEELLNDAARCGFEAAGKTALILDDFLRRNFNLGKIGGEPVLSLPNFRIKGVRNWRQEDFIDEFIKGYVKIKIPFRSQALKNFALTVPESFFAVFHLYARAGGPYGDWFRKFLKCPNFNLQSRGIAKRMEVVNSIPIKPNGKLLFGLPFHYGFHTVKYGREDLKVKAVSLARFLKSCKMK